MSAQGLFQPVPAHETEVELFSVAGVDGYLREVNVSFANLLGVAASALDGCSILELVHPDDVPDVVAGLAALEAGASEVMLENRFKHNRGGWTHLQWVARPLAGTDLWWAAGRDTTPYHQLLSEGFDLRARLDLAVGQSPAAMWELDVKSGHLTWESQAALLLGVDTDELPGTVAALAELVDPDDASAVADALSNLSPLKGADTELRAGKGPQLRHLALRGKVLEQDRRGRAVRAVGLLMDLTTEKAMEEQMLRMVMSDALTGIPNRRAFDQTLRGEWRRCARSKEPLSIVMMDIDNFKSFNDTFGHLIGDEVLTVVARTLTANLNRAGDSVARFGGEEFAIVLPGVDTVGAMIVAERLCDAVRGVTLRQAQGWRLSVSVGVASWCFENETLKSPQLLSRADQALYVAKSAGKDRAASYEATLANRGALEDAIRAGLDHNQFEMYYQPIICLNSGAVLGFEALMRWDRPGHGLVAPVEFLGEAEKSDLICDLGRLSLRHATHQLVAWIDAGLGIGHDLERGIRASARVSVNLSARHLTTPGVVGDVAAALQASGLPAKHLEVEVSETAVSSILVRQHLAQIRRLGVAVSLDDFGTGHTSMKDLSELPVDTLKVDPAFVAPSGPLQDDLVALVVAAARALHLRVTAERIEDPSVLHDLQRLGCHEAQGFALARPMPASDVLGWAAHAAISQRSVPGPGAPNEQAVSADR